MDGTTTATSFRELVTIDGKKLESFTYAPDPAKPAAARTRASALTAASPRQPLVAYVGSAHRPRPATRRRSRASTR